MTCEIPDVVGVRWGYKWFLSCMGTNYSLMHSCIWLPTCLAWFFLCVLFLSYPGKPWLSDRHLLRTYEHPSFPPTAALYWVGAETRLQVSGAQHCLNYSLPLLEWLWSLSLKPLWHFQRLLCALWWQAWLSKVASCSLKYRHFLGWLLLRRQTLALAKSSDSYSALHQYNAWRCGCI